MGPFMLGRLIHQPPLLPAKSKIQSNGESLRWLHSQQIQMKFMASFPFWNGKFPFKGVSRFALCLHDEPWGQGLYSIRQPKLWTCTGHRLLGLRSPVKIDKTALEPSGLTPLCHSGFPFSSPGPINSLPETSLHGTKHCRINHAGHHLQWCSQHSTPLLFLFQSVCQSLRARHPKIPFSVDGTWDQVLCLLSQNK